MLHANNLLHNGRHQKLCRPGAYVGFRFPVFPLDHRLPGHSQTVRYLLLGQLMAAVLICL